MKRTFLLLLGFLLTQHFASFGVQATAFSITSVHRDADGITLKLKPGTLKLQVFSPRVIRVVYSVEDKLPQTKSLAVIVAPAARVNWRVIETADEVRLRTDEIEARVNRGSGAVGFFDKDGRPLLVEKGGGGRSLTPARVGGVETLRSTQAFELMPDEAIYGLGQHQDGLLDYRDSTIHLQQENREVGLPVLVSTRGYGVLWDNPAVTDVNVGGGEEAVIPSAQLFNDEGVRGGLTGRYFRGRNFEELVATRTDPQIDFNWGQNLPPGLPSDGYSVRWTGAFEARQAGEYTLVAAADDGVRVFVDDRPVIDAWQPGTSRTVRARLKLNARSRHRLRVEYYQDVWGAAAHLRWRLPSDSPAVVWTSEAADAIDYYFMYGPELDRVVAAYRELTGAAPMFARWAWGFWQCRERYSTQQELLGVVEEYRRRKVPLDGIIQDWQYWKQGGWGSHAFDPERYPDPAGMVQEIHRANAHVLVSVWPRFDLGTPLLAELEKAGAAYPNAYPNVYPKGEGKWYDPFNPAGRRIYWKGLSEKLFKLKFDGWWMDASEAELGGKWGEMRDLQTGAGPGAKVFNAYPLMHSKGVYDGQRAETNAKRVLILTRSAWAGQQRNAAVTWSGDIFGNWMVFARQIPAGLNFSLSGIPYWNTDIGGFFGGDPADPEYAELFTRWFQFGTFCPMFRVHGTGKPKEIWRFDEATQRIMSDYINLRYHLLPYIYSVSWMVTDRGYTMMRPLAMDFRRDRSVYDIKDQYLFGPALMVNPVTRAGATSRSVYLPAGTTWTDFGTGKVYQGGRTVEASAPAATLPLFVRAGSIIPYGPAVQYAAEKSDPVELRIYRGADGSFTLYEDEGDSYNYEKGAYATIPIKWDESSGRLTIGKRRGSFPGMSPERTFQVVWVIPGHGTGIPQIKEADAVVHYHGSTMTISAPSKGK